MQPYLENSSFFTVHSFGRIGILSVTSSSGRDPFYKGEEVNGGAGANEAGEN